MLINTRQQLINQFLALEFPADEAALLADAELSKQQRTRQPNRSAKQTRTDSREIAAEVLV